MMLYSQNHLISIRASLGAQDPHTHKKPVHVITTRVLNSNSSHSAKQIEKKEKRRAIIGNYASQARCNQGQITYAQWRKVGASRFPIGRL